MHGDSMPCLGADENSETTLLTCYLTAISSANLVEQVAYNHLQIRNAYVNVT